MSFKPALLLLILLISEPTTQIGFLDALASPFNYLSRTFFGETGFKIDKSDKVNAELTKKFLELKDDGLALTYNLIYYNFILNLERECFAIAKSVDDCQIFAGHMKVIITNNIKTGKTGFKYILIQDFFELLFDVLLIDQNDRNAPNLRILLPLLKAHFNGIDFQPSKIELITHYNEVIRNLMNYLTDTNDQQEMVERFQIEQNIVQEPLLNLFNNDFTDLPIQNRQRLDSILRSEPYDPNRFSYHL